MPKSLNWLVLGELSNDMVSKRWRSPVLETQQPDLEMEVKEETFVTCVIFVYRRYLTGQNPM